MRGAQVNKEKSVLDLKQIKLNLNAVFFRISNLQFKGGTTLKLYTP